MRTTPLQMVHEFHTAFGAPISTSSMPELTDRTELRFNLIAEEVAEYAAAAVAEDPVEMLDALGDIVYVVCGAALEFGMTKRSVYLVLPPTNERFVPFTGFVDKTAFSMRAVLSGLRTAIDNRDVVVVSACLARMYLEALDLAEYLNLPLYEALVEIHRSNMAKLGPDGVPLVNSVGKIMKPPGWTPPNLAAVLARAA